jgi:hypothetical protein
MQTVWVSASVVPMSSFKLISDQKVIWFVVDFVVSSVMRGLVGKICVQNYKTKILKRMSIPLEMRYVSIM